MTAAVPAPLTEAERLAAEALHRHFTENDSLGIESINPDDFADEARAVVASVKPQIAAEALREAAKYLYEHRRDNDGAFDLWQMYEAGGPEWLSSRANAALSLPASKETPDA